MFQLDSDAVSVLQAVCSTVSGKLSCASKLEKMCLRVRRELVFNFQFPSHAVSTCHLWALPLSPHPLASNAVTTFSGCAFFGLPSPDPQPLPANTTTIELRTPPTLLHIAHDGSKHEIHARATTRQLRGPSPATGATFIPGKRALVGRGEKRGRQCT